MRTNELYISPQTHRWLRWVADAQAERTTPDALADRVLQEHLLKEHPDLPELDRQYNRAVGEARDIALSKVAFSVAGKPLPEIKPLDTRLARLQEELP